MRFETDGGAGKYAEYAAAAGPFVAELGGVIIDGFRPELAVIAEWDPDFFFIVEWPTPTGKTVVPAIHSGQATTIASSSI